MKATPLPLALVFGAMTPLPAMAQEDRLGFSAGVAAAFSSDPYVGEDSQIRALPVLRYKAENFSIGTDGIYADILTRNDVTLEFVALPRFSGLDDPDAPELAGIERDITLDAGLKLTYGLAPRTDLSATLLQEVTGEHDGQELQLEVSNTLMLGRLPVSLAAGLSWKSADLGTYMYGVYAAEATGTRPAYGVGDSITPYVSVFSGFPVSDRVTVFGSIKAEFLDDKISDSPIVDDDEVISGILGISYSF